MHERAFKKIEVTANVLIIGVALLAVVVFAQNLMGGPNEKAAGGAAPVAPELERERPDGSFSAFEGLSFLFRERGILSAPG
jgi:hypothetical protein